MADCYVIFRQRMPFSARLKGAKWDVSLQMGAKSDYYTIVAARRGSEGKFYVLTSGKEMDVQSQMHRGIPVKSGTPERGLVTELWREGYAILLHERLPRPAVRFAL